jgi:hypothetical protein
MAAFMRRLQMGSVIAADRMAAGFLWPGCLSIAEIAENCPNCHMCKNP